MPIAPPQPPNDQLDWEPALAYLPILSAPDFDPGDWAGGGQLGPNHYATRYVAFSEDIERFITCLYDTDIVAGTDWTTWLREGGEAFYVEPDRLAEATLEQCRMLLIAHVRADRFSEGHLLETLRSGHLVQLLQRIRTLVDQDA